jgi:hypothetical protein
MDKRIDTKGHIQWYWGELNAFVDPMNATATELNALLNMTNAVSYNDTDFGVQASETIDDPSFAAIGATLTRGAAQYGGSISNYYPGVFDDPSNSLSNTYDAMYQNHIGYVVIRNDGNKTWEDAWEAGDLYSIFKVITAGEDQSITGADAFRYTITHLQQGELGVYLVVDGSPAIDVVIDSTNAGAMATVGAVGKLTADVTAGTKVRGYTKGLVWTSSDPTLVTVRSGITKRVGAGTGSVTITATYEPTGANDTYIYTIS